MSGNKKNEILIVPETLEELNAKITLNSEITLEAEKKNSRKLLTMKIRI